MRNARDSSVTVLVTNHALPRHAIETEQIRITLTATAPRHVVCRRIDGEHANAEREWRALDSPAYLDAAIMGRLHEASRVRHEPLAHDHADGVCRFDIAIPAHAVAAVRVEF